MTYVVEVRCCQCGISAGRVRVHPLPEPDKQERPVKVIIMFVHTDKLVHVLYDVIGGVTVSNAVHLPGDAAVETSIVVRPVRSCDVVVVSFNGVSWKESRCEGRELQPK